MRTRTNSRFRPIRLGALMLAFLASAGCESISYYTHVSSGQLSLLSKREPVDQVIASLSASTDEAAVQVRVISGCPGAREIFIGVDLYRNFGAVILEFHTISEHCMSRASVTTIRVNA